MGADSPGAGWQRWLRPITLVIVGLQSIGMLAILWGVLSSGQLTSGEALSRSLGLALLEIYGLPYVCLSVPALVLALFNRYLPAALALSLLAIPAGWLTFRFA